MANFWCLNCLILILGSLVQSLEPYHFSDAPKLHPLQKDHVVEQGQNWKLKCSGKYPVEWSLPLDDIPPTSEAKPLAERVTFDEETIEGHNPRPYIIHLEVKNLHYLDTGPYFCRYKGTKDNQDSENVTKTYLYVKSQWSLFDYSSSFTWVNVPQYVETVIPCRPTDPQVDVRFFKKHEDITNDLEAMQMKYEPERGLIITRGSLELHSGIMVECRAKRGNLTNTIKAILQFQVFPVILPPPFIKEVNPLSKVYVGANISLSCELPVDLSMPHIELIWTFPSPTWKDDIRIGRIQVEEQKRERITEGSEVARMYPGNSVIIRKPIHIEPVEEKDVGIYTCKAVAQAADKASHPQKYHLERILNDVNQASIGDPNFFGDPAIIVKQSQTVDWVFDLQANPDPGFTWIHPTGIEIDYTTLEKYEMDIEEKTDKVKLHIHYVELEDTGKYTFNVEVKGNDGQILTKDVEMTLEYVRQPYVDFFVSDIFNNSIEEPTSTLVELNQMYRLSCQLEGYPLDTQSVKWKFQKCQDAYDNCNDPVEIANDNIRPIDGNVDQSIHYRYVSEMLVTAEESGIYTCEVCSEFEQILRVESSCNQSSASLFVTDFKTGFDLETPQDSVVDGDQIELLCSVSVYKYHPPKWLKKGIDGNWNEITENMISTNKTQFSHITTLYFDPVSLSDKGSYICSAQPLNSTETETEDRLYFLRVESIMKPMKTLKNNMNGTEVTIDTSNEHNGHDLRCTVTGRPTPEIIWTKDDEILTATHVENNTYLELLDGDQILSIKYAHVRDSGEYKCTATNRGGSVSYTLKLNVRPEQRLSIGLIVGVIACLVFLIIVSIVLCWKVKVYNRKYKELTKAELNLFVEGDPKSINPELGVDEQVELLPYNRDYEFSRDQLRMGKQLGSGAFGRVLKARAFGIVPWERETIVAVKMVKQHADITYIRALMAELKIMIHLGKHLNIVNLLGACTTSLNRRELLIIVEYCRFGNIQRYLLRHRNHFINQIDPSTSDLNFQIGSEIIAKYGNDLARAREEDELSAAYAGGASTRHLSVTGATGYNSENRRGSHQNGGIRNQSIRYIADPSRPDAANMVGQKRSRQESVRSDYNDGLGQIVMTDMTTVTMTSENNADLFSRSMSMNSHASNQGPGWRANMRGDYDLTRVKPISTKDLICWAYQVTRGMEYLAKKKIMHGDLACRNILLAADNVVKICDFGLAKDIYKSDNYRKKTDGPLPVKWMAIESIRDRIFSTQSDAWSFGIVLWEMFSLGKTPYPGIDTNQLYVKLLDGYRMEKPEYCPGVIYKVMMDCWKDEPTQRPSFTEMVDFLGDLLEDGERDNYLDLSNQFSKLHTNSDRKTSCNAVENRDYLGMMSAPDFKMQMSVLPDEDDYLVPNGQHQAVSEDEGGYLMPKSNEHMADQSGYLIPTNSPLPDVIVEEKPLMQDKDISNIELQPIDVKTT